MNKLVVSTLESRFRLYDMRTFHPVHGYSFLSQAAHESTVWAPRHLPQNRDVVIEIVDQLEWLDDKRAIPALQQCTQRWSGDEEIREICQMAIEWLE